VQAFFLYPIIVCSSDIRKFVLCPFVDKKETNGCFSFANRLNGLNVLNGLSHLCIIQHTKYTVKKLKSHVGMSKFPICATVFHTEFDRFFFSVCAFSFL
jgi:hypothetical protein